MDILGLIIIIWHDTWSFIKQDKGTTFPPEKEKAMRKNGTPEKVSKEKNSSASKGRDAHTVSGWSATKRIQHQS